MVCRLGFLEGQVHLKKMTPRKVSSCYKERKKFNFFFFLIWKILDFENQLNFIVFLVVVGSIRFWQNFRKIQNLLSLKKNISEFFFSFSLEHDITFFKIKRFSAALGSSENFHSALSGFARKKILFIFLKSLND